MKRLASKGAYLKFQIAAWPSLVWFYIRSSKLFTRALAALIVVSWTAAFFAGGYFYSQHRFDDLMGDFEQMSKRYNLPYEGVDWPARFSALQRWVEVEDKAAEKMKEYLYEKDRRIKELEEHLYFYRTVVAPEEGGKDLSIFSVNVGRSEEERVYPIEVILRNHDTKKGAVKGSVKILVEGETGLPGIALVRDDLLKDELKFSFKYFQRLKGVLRLPARFNPSRLSVVVDSRKSKPVKETYAWAALLAKNGSPTRN